MRVACPQARQRRGEQRQISRSLKPGGTSRCSRESRLGPLNIGVAIVFATISCATAALAQPARTERIVINYASPTNPAHKQFYEVLKENQALEQVRDLLAGI